ncbi:hypothetical protein JOB18_031419 [Solea senegalensis]|uniref:Uncharacterized protein n=1 Tax=Solea senegalensis TaxID=28829 RepID=A0AAV6Q141_SOLSE|nr:hypothetical protein JOB18_031419 [Solea senegalensis]
MSRVSEDRTGARQEGRWFCGLARQRAAQRTSKQTVMDRWVSHGCGLRSGQFGSQMGSSSSSSMSVQTGILAQRVFRPAHESPGQQ